MERARAPSTSLVVVVPLRSQWKRTFPDRFVVWISRRWGRDYRVWRPSTRGRGVRRGARNGTEAGMTSNVLW